MMITKSLVIVAFVALTTTSAFVVTPRTSRPPTKLFLEDHIADMIDKELVRLAEKKETDKAWEEKNKPYVKQDLPTGFDFDESTLMNDTVLAPRVRRKDKRLARNDPQKYCADRCIATGNCEVFEDIFNFSPQQVREFCEECVLSDDEEPCDVPEALFGDDDEGSSSYDGPLKP